MKNMTQGTKEVRVVTEEKIQWDSSRQRKEQRQAVPAERAEHLWRETPKHSPGKHFTPCGTLEGKLPVPVPQLQ